MIIPGWWRVAGGPTHTPGAWTGAHMYGPGKFTGGYEAVQGFAQAMIIQNKSRLRFCLDAPPGWWRPAGLVLICTDRASLQGVMKQVYRASLRR